MGARPPPYRGLAAAKRLGKGNHTFCLLSTAKAQQQIPAGGPISGRSGFKNSVDDPKFSLQVEEVVRKVAENVYVIAGAGGRQPPENVTLVQEFTQQLVKLPQPATAVLDWIARCVCAVHKGASGIFTGDAG